MSIDTKDHKWVDVTTEGGFEITDQTPDLDHPTTLEIDSSDTVWGIALKTAADPDWKPRYQCSSHKKETKELAHLHKHILDTHERVCEPAGRCESGTR
jgi:hypothetical protein